MPSDAAIKRKESGQKVEKIISLLYDSAELRNCQGFTITSSESGKALRRYYSEFDKNSRNTFDRREIVIYEDERSGYRIELSKIEDLNHEKLFILKFKESDMDLPIRVMYEFNLRDKLHLSSPDAFPLTPSRLHMKIGEAVNVSYYNGIPEGERKMYESIIDNICKKLGVE